MGGGVTKVRVLKEGSLYKRKLYLFIKFAFGTREAAGGVGRIQVWFLYSFGV